MSSLVLETNSKPAKEAEETTMEEEFVKRNTDCVYFLASPLTCRKGAECEYRHSEIARLNPRDCWYWMSGSCLNPTCAFRHPPLEKPSESASELDSLQNQTAASTNKTDVPCYFYFNGFCNKGDKCSFSHGPDMFTVKSVKPSSAVAGVLPGKKTSAGNEAVPTLKKAHINPPDVASKIAVDLIPNQVLDSHQTVPRRIIQDRSPQVMVPQHENESVVNSSSVFLEGDLVPRETYTPSYQNSEDQVDEFVEVEERLESSPENFDVLVDDKSEYLAYEEDEYLQAIERERRELNSHFLGDDFADQTEYDPSYPDPEHFFEGEMVGSYDRVDNIRTCDDVGNDSRDRMLNSEPSRKRKIHSSEVAINGQRGQDLRDHLRKRKTGGYGYGADRLGRNGDSYRRTSQSEERHRHGISQRLRGRLVLHAGKAGAESLGNNGTFSDGGIQWGWIHDTPPSMSRQGFVGRRPANRQFLPSERQRRSGSGDRKSSEERVAFSGPKTLAQLREEKKKAGENEDCIGIMGQSSHMESADFEGPKPLSAILKDKRRPSSAVAGNGS